MTSRFCSSTTIRVNSEFIAGGNDAVLSVSPMNNGLRAIYTISDRLQFGEVRRNSAQFGEV